MRALDIARLILGAIVGAMAAVWLIVYFVGGITGFIGNLIKYRAQYFPKEINPKYNEELPPEVLIATTYFEIAERAKWREGIPGLVRGLGTVICGCFFVLFVGVMDKLGRPLPKDPVSTILFQLITIPISVLTVRAITTPVLLPFFDIPLALDTLLTPEERAQPWQLYLLPGIIPLVLLQATWNRLVLPRLRETILSRVPHHEWRYGFSTTKVVASGLAVLDMVVSNPIDVVAVRLLLMDVNDVFMVDEPVLNLRTGRAPYAGIWDCVRCIVEEEGVETLCRGWVMSLLARMTTVLKVKKDSGVSVVSSTNTRERDEEKGEEKEKEKDMGEGDRKVDDEKASLV